MCDNVRELASAAEAMLRSLGYKDSTIRHYRESWNRVIAFCGENDVEGYDKETEAFFFAYEGIASVPGLTPHQRDRVRNVRCLLTAKEGKLPATWREPGPQVPEGLVAAHDSYIDDMRGRGLSDATNMLAGDVPYPVISGILGHSNANTTRKYLAVDVERLRAMSLEVPHA